MKEIASRLLDNFSRLSEAPDAVPRLRRFVLDLAVRGKLVEPDPNEEAASALLEPHSTIAAQRLPSSARKVEQVPFALPSGWLWSRVGLITTKTGSGSTPRGGKSVYKSHGVPFLRSQNVYNDGLRLDDVAYIDHETHARMKGTSVEPGDLLLNITGGSIGRCARVPDFPIDANISQHVAIIRLANSHMRDFMHRVVLSPFFQSFVIDEQTGAGRGGLPKNRMDQIPVPIPPLAEQRRIVAKVDELMALCDRLEAVQTKREQRRDRLVAASLNRINQPAPSAEGEAATAFREHARFHLDHLPRLTTRPEHIKTLRQAILNLAVRGRLVPQDPGERTPDLPEQATRVTAEGKLHFEMPFNWRWARVSEVASARLGKMLDKAKNRGSPYRYLRNTNVHWFEVRTGDLKQVPLGDDEVDEYLLRIGDVLICEGGHGIGRTAVWRGKQEPMAFQKALHRVRPGDHLHPDFFAFCCFVYFHENIMQTYFTGVGIPHFTGKALSRLIFPLPPLAEQQRIVAKVDELMSVCDQLEAQLTTAQTDSRRLLEAVLHQALTPAPNETLHP